jgi:deoxyxylulose-5-phosphate synthase
MEMVGLVPDRILDSIDAPCDVKKLDEEQLAQLATEIREELVSTVSQTGGHLAPNLGVVEPMTGSSSTSATSPMSTS